MSNHFGQPIRKFELWICSEKNPEQLLLLWEASFNENEQKQVSVSIPTDALRSQFNPPVYFLHYRVELEDGQWISNNLSLPFTESALSLRGAWVYAHRGWPLDDEAYLAMEVAPF